MGPPQFGRPQAELAYPDRPAAFTVIPRGATIAVVRVTLRNGDTRLDLPGGGIDPDETAGQAAARECGEEAGLRVLLEDQPFLLADHFFINEDGQGNNTRGSFFAADSWAEAPSLKIEDDHALDWMTPQEALLRLDRESHAWAVVCWLRGGARRDQRLVGTDKETS